MTERTTLEKYLLIIEETAVDAAVASGYGALTKFIELGFSKFISQLGISVVDEILHSDNLMAAMTQIVLFNSINAAAKEASYQASLISNSNPQKAIHQLNHAQLTNQLNTIKSTFIQQFANGASDLESAVTRAFNVTSEVGSKLLAHSVGGVLAYHDITKDLDEAIENGTDPDEVAANLVSDLIAFATTSIAGLSASVNTTVAVRGVSSALYVLGHAAGASALLTGTFVFAYKVGTKLYEKPIISENAIDIVEFLHETYAAVSGNQDAFPDQEAMLAILANHIDSGLSSKSLVSIIEASSETYVNQQEIYNTYNSFRDLISPQLPILEAANKEQFYQAVLNVLDVVKINYPATSLSIISVADLTPAQIYQKAKTEEGVAYRYALQELNPFVIIGPGLLYEQHNIVNSNGIGLLDVDKHSDKYYQDRSALLIKKVEAFTQDTRFIADETTYRDESQDFNIVKNPNTIGVNKHIYFGSDGADTYDHSIIDAFSPIVEHLYGGDGNDTFYGGGKNDYIEGNDGNDVLYGQDDIDQLYGNDGNDELHGGDGNDFLEGKVTTLQL